MTAPGPAELIIILLVLVLLFGARKLPELAGSVGRSITSFKRGMKEATEEDPDTGELSADGDAGSGEATRERNRDDGA